MAVTVVVEALAWAITDWTSEVSWSVEVSMMRRAPAASQAVAVPEKTTQAQPVEPESYRISAMVVEFGTRAMILRLPAVPPADHPVVTSKSEMGENSGTPKAVAGATPGGTMPTL